MIQSLQCRLTQELQVQELEDFTPLILLRCIDFQDSYLYSYRQLKFYPSTKFKSLLLGDVLQKAHCTVLRYVTVTGVRIRS